MNLRYFERRTEVVRAYVRAENGCEETNHFVKPSAIELARIAEARNGRKKFDVFVKPNGQSRACASRAMARNGRKKFNVFAKPNGQSRACTSRAMARKRTKEIQLKHLPFNLTPMKKLLHPLTRLLLAVGLSAFSVVAFAQKTAVNGIVTDAEGAPLVGATVIVMQNARPEGGGLRPTPKVNLP